MEYKKLGLTDLEISRIGFGCWAIGGHGYGNVNDDESIKAIQTALELGVNFFDTADVYGFGHSEKILSRALGKERNKVVIATKFGVNWDKKGNVFKDCSPKRIIEALDGSLKRLKINCIPLYQIHWYDGITPITEVMRTLKKCQKAGKIRYIGCSNLSTALIFEACKIQRIESVQFLYNFSQKNLEKDTIKCLESLNIGAIAYGVLGRGLFSGKYSLDSKFPENDTRSKDKNFQGEELEKNLRLVSNLKRIGRRYNKTPSQVAIRWVLDNPAITCVLTGAKSPQQIVENSGALGWKLLKEDREVLAKFKLNGIPLSVNHDKLL